MFWRLEQKHKNMATVNIYSTVGDGVVENNTTSWSTARGNSSGTGVGYTGTSASVKSGKISPSDWRISRMFLAFDTSSLSGATITGCVLHLRTKTQNPYGYSSRNIGVVGATQTSVSELAVEDFSKAGTTRFASDVSIDGDDADANKSWTFNSTGLAAIDINGYTKLCIKTSLDIDDSEPSDDGNLSFYTSESDYDPYLEITYTGSSNTTNFFQLF